MYKDPFLQVKKPNQSDVLVNVRINQELKDEFEKLCKANHTNMSREIKRFISLAISTQKLT